MFKFDDRYIILVILIPGFFLLSNLYISLNFYPLLFSANSYNTVSAPVYGLVLSIILGSICWWIHNKKWISYAFNTSCLLKNLRNNTINNKKVNLNEIKRRYLIDFGLPLLLDNENEKAQQTYLKGSVDNMFFTMDRAFGLNKPSAYRLLLDALSAIVIATFLSIAFLIITTIVFTIFVQNETTYNGAAIKFGCVLAAVFLLLKLLVIPSLREYYHYAIFVVYLDTQYRNKIHQFIHGKKM